MPKKSEDRRLHQKAYHHVRKHRKKYVRFILFFIFLLIFRIIEDYFLLTSTGFELEFDIIILIIVIFSAIIFTGISEITEILIEEGEAKKLLEFIREEEPKLEELIEKEEKIIKKKIKRKNN